MSSMGISTVDKVSRTASVKSTGQPAHEVVPPLENGDHLTRAEFERRYKAHPHIKKAELIEGVVYMPSPVHYQGHGEPHIVIAGWLLHYMAATPGVRAADNTTVRLDLDNEVQPDVLLRVDESAGGQSRVTDDDYIEGAPELVIEVAASSASVDLHEKLNVYRRNEVQEYLVLLSYEQEIIWYVLEEGEYRSLVADENGVLRSRVFPGLHFHPEMFWDGNLAGLLEVLQEGVKTPEHAEFVARLEAARAERFTG